MSKKNSKHELRAVFMETFIKELIMNSKVAPAPIVNTEKIVFPEQEENFDVVRGPMSMNRKVSPFRVREMGNVSRKPRVERAVVPERAPARQMAVPSGPPNTNKILPLLKDPRVRSIECKGAGQFVLINKSGLVQTTPVVLSDEEISLLIDEFSKKTRIPLVGGMLKAALGNLIMTAVVSQDGKGRFVVQKK